MIEIEKKAYKSANDRVGNVGESTNIAYSVTGERYICYSFSTTDFKEITKIFDRLISEYIPHSKNVKNEGYEHDINAKPIIYWRCKPEIKAIENRYTFYARLLISTKPELDEVTKKIMGISFDETEEHVIHTGISS